MLLSFSSNKHLWFPASLLRRRRLYPTPVFLPGKSHGQRSLVGCSRWGCWGSDMTEWLHFHFSFSWIGEGNGNPLQCSCLENPRDGEAWWAGVYGVTQSRTRLKWQQQEIILLWKSTRKIITPLSHANKNGCNSLLKYFKRTLKKSRLCITTVHLKT